MNAASIACPKCQTPLPPTLINMTELVHCPSCGTGLFTVAFPALLKGPAAAQAGETLLVDGDVSCFYHPRKKAAAVCEYCGRFLCALCDVVLHDNHLCPACIESGAKKDR